MAKNSYTMVFELLFGSSVDNRLTMDPRVLVDGEEIEMLCPQLAYTINGTMRRLITMDGNGVEYSADITDCVREVRDGEQIYTCEVSADGEWVRIHRTEEGDDEYMIEGGLECEGDGGCLACRTCIVCNESTNSGNYNESHEWHCVDHDIQEPLVGDVPAVMG